MTSWAIVAIPEDGDTTWKLSSEDVPHLTILFLGEQEDQGDALHIAEYLQHVVNNSVNRFWLDVDRRGVLGDKEADVLFFDSRLNKRALEDLANFRAYLLQDPVIARLHGSVEQFDTWTPHLTMGYPEKPAKKPTSDFVSNKIYSVYFDRIAFWVGESEGPTFNLEYKDALASSSDTVAHRRDHRMKLEQQFLRPSDLLARNAQARQSSKSKSNFGAARPVQHMGAFDRALHRSIAAMRPTPAAELNHGEQHQYEFIKHMYQNMPSRTKADIQRRVDVVARPDNDWLVSVIEPGARRATVMHRLHPVVDENGTVSDYELVHEELTNSDMRLALMHYGVKGMKWGVRRQGGGDGGGGLISSLKDKRAISKEAKAKAKELEGNPGSGVPGKKTREEKVAEKAQKLANKREAKEFDRKLSKPKASEDAEISNQARKRTEKHGTDLMSNKELQAMVTRMNLEQQYQNLQESGKARSARTAGKEYVGDILKQAGQEIAVELIKGAAASAGNAARNQATNSGSRSRTFVSTTARRARGQQQQIGPGLREILQLPPGRG